MKAARMESGLFRAVVDGPELRNASTVCVADFFWDQNPAIGSEFMVMMRRFLGIVISDPAAF